jgi:hypothetical protein
MTSRIWIGWVLVGSAVAALFLPSAIRYRHAVAAHTTANAIGAVNERLQSERDAVIKSLPAWARLLQTPDNEPALAQRFTAAATSAGVPPASVEAFTPAPSAVIDIAPGPKHGPKIVRARATASLTSVTLPLLGRLLDSWRTAAPGWTVTQIEITPLRLAPAEAARYAGSDLPLRVSLTVERLTAAGLDMFLPIPGNQDASSKGPKDQPQ